LFTQAISLLSYLNSDYVSIIGGVINQFIETSKFNIPLLVIYKIIMLYYPRSDISEAIYEESIKNLAVKYERNNKIVEKSLKDHLKNFGLKFLLKKDKNKIPEEEEEELKPNKEIILYCYFLYQANNNFKSIKILPVKLITDLYLMDKIELEELIKFFCIDNRFSKEICKILMKNSEIINENSFSSDNLKFIYCLLHKILDIFFQESDDFFACFFRGILQKKFVIFAYFTSFF